MNILTAIESAALLFSLPHASSCLSYFHPISLVFSIFVREYVSCISFSFAIAPDPARDSWFNFYLIRSVAFLASPHTFWAPLLLGLRYRARNCWIRSALLLCVRVNTCENSVVDWLTLSFRSAYTELTRARIPAF